VITISQFVFGLCLTAYAASMKEGLGGSVTKCHNHSCPLKFFSATGSTDPSSDLRRVLFRGTMVHGYRIYHHVSCIRYGTFLALNLKDTHSDHPADLLAFSVIVYLVVRSNVKKVPIPGLLRTIAQDAAYYFLATFTSHFVLVIFLALEDPEPHVRILS